MRRSTKIMGVVLVVAAGAAAAAPLVTAGMAEQRLRAFAESDPFEQSPHVDWTLKDYESGYLHAQATSELTFRHPENGESYTLVLAHEIDHALAAGQSLLRIRTVPRIPEGPAQTFVEQVFGDREPLTIDFRVRVDGTSVAHVRSPSSDGMREFEHGAIEWQGLDGTATLSADQRSVEYDFEAPGLRIEPRAGETESVVLGMTRAGGAFQESQFDRIWVGQGSLSVDHVTADGPPDGSVSITGIEISEEVSVQQDLVWARIDARIGEIVGPDDRLTDLKLALAINRISPELLQAADAIARETAGMESDQEGGRITRQILGRVPWGAVALAEPSFVIETLQAHAREGALKASGKIGLTAPPQSASNQLRMLDLPRFAHAEVSLRAPQTVVVEALSEVAMARSKDVTEADAQRKAMQRLQMLQSQGWLQSGEGDYFATASYDRGMIRINGSGLFGMGSG